ncbi:MAG: WYL domain-containing protein [Saprospiraceae bacterium]|nr:WYL domain-containing protein [Saprospiraceae bacterium]
MPKDTEYGTRARLINVLLILVQSPFRHTLKSLADRYAVTVDTLEGDIKVLRDAGLTIEKDEKSRYALVIEKPYQELKHLLHFSEEDQALLYQAIDNLPNSTKRHQQLKSKLGALYDFSRLGHSYLRRPYLTKVDLLEQARKEKKQVALENYHSSNSSKISHRFVEPFFVSPAEDMIHAIDVEQQQVRHFRISRCTRVRLLNADWQYEKLHTVMQTDPFRIVNNEQVMVRLRLSVGAYNELTERYPLTRNYIEPTEDPTRFEFQCRVNHEFKGLSNFILGFYHLDMEVLEPESLLEHLRREIANMRF